jgi:hypothetical protein
MTDSVDYSTCYLMPASKETARPSHRETVPKINPSVTDLNLPDEYVQSLSRIVKINSRKVH